MKILKGCFLLVTILLLSSCTIKVKTFYDESAPFDQYEKFCWFTGCEFTIDGPDYIKKDSASVDVFRNAITDELKRKGFIYDENNPDFLVYVQILVEEKETVISSPYDEEDWGVHAVEQFATQPYVYLKGSMVIDIADAEESNMVWRSDAVSYMTLNPDVTESNIAKGVRQALKKFPPKD